MTTEKSFQFFNYTEKSCESCCDAMDVMPNLSRSDNEDSKIHCAQCQWICWPLIVIFDILSCPCRFCIYCKNKNNHN